MWTTLLETGVKQSP